MASSPAHVIGIDSQQEANGAGEPRAATKSAGVAPPPAGEAAPTTSTMSSKVMSGAANLAQLLPTGSVLAYQAVAPSFTRDGKCLPTNQWLTAVLVAVIAGLSFFFSFTDSLVGRDGKLYYGVATPRGFNVFNLSDEEEKKEWMDDLRIRLRLRPIDFMHAFFTALVFITVVFSDVALQNCFFPDASDNTQELLKNLPLGMALLSSFVFLIFPTKRKGIGYNDTTPRVPEGVVVKESLKS